MTRNSQSSREFAKCLPFKATKAFLYDFVISLCYIEHRQYNVNDRPIITRNQQIKNIIKRVHRILRKLRNLETIIFVLCFTCRIYFYYHRKEKIYFDSITKKCRYTILNLYHMIFAIHILYYSLSLIQTSSNYLPQFGMKVCRDFVRSTWASSSLNCVVLDSYFRFSRLPTQFVLGQASLKN